MILPMSRSSYKIYSSGSIADMTIPNRLVRSATWDPSLFKQKKMSDEILEIYRGLAKGGIGLIITGGFPVLNERTSLTAKEGWLFRYSDLRVSGIERMVTEVRGANPDCRIVAQIENGGIRAQPSVTPSPFSKNLPPELTETEIGDIIDCFTEGITDIYSSGFDGVQLHAAHGGILSRFLSPYTNRRNDAYGGNATKRVRIIKEIIAKARKEVGRYPILVKANCTDYLAGGTDYEKSPEIAYELEKSGVDAIEVSGGVWDSLARSREELGFRPVPAPESHTQINRAEQQSYFLRYVKNLDLSIPIILVGGNRNIERLEEIIQSGYADFIAMSRPLIREPDLPNRWLEGRGRETTECISCNSCIYDMYLHPGRPEPSPVSCIHKNNRELHREAQEWLSSWVERHLTAQ